MERKIILKNTETGQELTLPVTPSSYPMEAGRTVERIDMAQTGQLALPGLKQLFSAQLEFMLPAKQYPFCASDAVVDPGYYIEQLTAWSAAGSVCRYIVTGTAINSPVLLGPLQYGEDDGSNDVVCTLPLYEYRYLDEVQVQVLTQNNSRAQEGSSQADIAKSYVVAAGDSLWSICKKFYGDGTLAYKLASANGIANPTLIWPGQVLTLPDISELTALAAIWTVGTGAQEAETDARAAARAAIGLGGKTIRTMSVK